MSIERKTATKDVGVEFSGIRGKRSRIKREKAFSSVKEDKVYERLDLPFKKKDRLMKKWESLSVGGWSGWEQGTAMRGGKFSKSRPLLE